MATHAMGIFRAARPAPVTLRWPRPPAAAATYAWRVRGFGTGVDRRLTRLELSGCWRPRQVVRVAVNARAAHTRVDRRGVISVAPLRGVLFPFEITVTFARMLRGTATGSRATFWAGRGSRVSVSIAGPACRLTRRPPRRPAPTPTATTATRTTVPTLSATATRAFAPAASPTSTSAPTSTPAPTATPTALPTPTITPPATSTPALPPSATPTGTATGTPIPRATGTPIPRATATPTASPAATATSCAAAGSAPYLHTCGSRIVDAVGTPVRLRAANWYGFESNDFVATGLHDWSYKTIIVRLKSQGFNALRLPFSDELVERDPIVSALSAICTPFAGDPTATVRSCVPVPGTATTPITGGYLLAAISDTVRSNSDLVGLDALHVLKTIVDYAGSQGLRVILDDHRSRAGWGTEESGLWYTSADCSGAAPHSCYDPASWLRDWQTVGQLFATDPAVIGLDLRNEPHALHRPSSCADDLSLGTSTLNGAHWGPCGGQNNAATDWPQAATQAGNALLALNPNWLLFVEGVSSYPQSDGSFSADGWGENLQGVATDPIALSVPHRVVYAPHDYYFFEEHNGFNSTATISGMYRAWTRTFGFVAVPGSSYTAPLWVGEFGTCTDRSPNANRNTCIMSPPPGSAGYDLAGWWFNTLRLYEENRCVSDPATSGAPTVCPAGAAPTYLGGPLNWAYWAGNGIYDDGWSYSQYQWADSTATNSAGQRVPSAGGKCYGNREPYGVLGGDMQTDSSPLLLQSLFVGPSTDPTAAAPPTPAPSGPWPAYDCTPYSG